MFPRLESELKSGKSGKEMMRNLERLADALNKAGASVKQPFLERRSEPRLWCSDLIEVWTRETGRWRRHGSAVLEDISKSGACVQLESPLPQGRLVRLKHPQWKVEGEVRYCLYRDLGYFVGVLVNEKHRAMLAGFKPKHLLDPARVKPKGKGK